MNKIVSYALLLASCCASSCVLHSVTMIDTAKTFVLGEGQHGVYNATIKNIGIAAVEVFQKEAENAPTSIGVLQPDAEKSYRVGGTTTILFKNIGQRQAQIKIKLLGDKQLSMGYKNN
ncbi:MAG: hypothetical protein RL329_2272 [Bacteroidota bacterium]